MFDGVHRLYTIFDIVETFSQRLQAIVCLLPKKQHHRLELFQLLSGLVSVCKLVVDAVQDLLRF
jgi:hypothetical protein